MSRQASQAHCRLRHTSRQDYHTEFGEAMTRFTLAVDTETAHICSTACSCLVCSFNAITCLMILKICSQR